MQPIYKNPNLPGADQIYRITITIWAAMLFSQLMLLILVFFSKPELFDFGAGENLNGSNQHLFSSLNPVIIVLAFLGLVIFALSFVLKTRLLKLAIDNKQITLVQTAEILAYALCEAITLFGLIAAFAFDSPLFFVFLAIGITGTLLHFPRRNNFEAASFSGIN